MQDWICAAILIVEFAMLGLTSMMDRKVWKHSVARLCGLLAFAGWTAVMSYWWLDFGYFFVGFLTPVISPSFKYAWLRRWLTAQQEQDRIALILLRGGPGGFVVSNLLSGLSQSLPGILIVLWIPVSEPLGMLGLGMICSVSLVASTMLRLAYYPTPPLQDAMARLSAQFESPEPAAAQAGTAESRPIGS